MKLIIEDDEGRKTVVPIVRDVITIGRQDGNTIRLTERNVSRRHARLLRENGSLLIEDLGSANGVRVNGNRIRIPTRLQQGDRIEIGDYDLGVQVAAEARGDQETGTPDAAAANGAPSLLSAASAGSAAAGAAQPVAAAEAGSDPFAAAREAAAASASADRTGTSAQARPHESGTAVIRRTNVSAPPPAAARELAAADRPRLVGLAGVVAGREFVLGRTSINIGRAADNDIGIDHPSLSRLHCRLVREEAGNWTIYDCQSANGVRINGEEYALSPVKGGDVLELGHLQLRFCSPGDTFKAPAAPAKTTPDRPSPAVASPAPARAAPSAAPAQRPAGGKKAGPGVPLVPLSLGALVVAAIVGVLLVRKSGPPAGAGAGSGAASQQEPASDAPPSGQATQPPGPPSTAASTPEPAQAAATPEAAASQGQALVQKGDAAFEAHDYAAAGDLYDKAAVQGVSSPRKEQTVAERRAQATHAELLAAISGGDFDRAYAALEKCKDDAAYFCAQAREKGPEVRAGYAALHLARAGETRQQQPDVCKAEVALVLASDPKNAEAQALAPACAPRPPAAAPPGKPAAGADARAKPGRPAPAAAPSNRKSQAEDRETRATNLVAEANQQLSAGDAAGARRKYQQALDLKPAADTAGLIYRGLGTAAVQLHDSKDAARWFKAYLPLCPDAEKEQVQQLIDENGG